MRQQLQQVLDRNNFRTFFHDNVMLLGVESAEVGIKNANTILLELVDRNTSLFLSGGTTPRDLYRDFAMDQMIVAGAVGMVDERYGEKHHAVSNEKMIRETTFLDYLERQHIPFYPMLSDQHKTREQTARDYEETFQKILSETKTSVAILGIGADGHTAGIVPNRGETIARGFQNPLFESYQKGLLVSEFNDPDGLFKERITLTFEGLSMIDTMLVLAFGESKRHALKELFKSGPEEEIPARFYKRPNIAEKTLIITDQDV